MKILDILEKLILFAYYPKQSKTECINIERMNAFNANPNWNLRLISFSRNGLREHTNRACLQSGWLWKEGENKANWNGDGKWKTISMYLIGSKEKFLQLLKT